MWFELHHDPRLVFGEELLVIEKALALGARDSSEMQLLVIACVGSSPTIIYSSH